MNPLNDLLTRIERGRMWQYFHKDWLLQVRAALRPQLPPEYFLFVESETLLISPDDPHDALTFQPDVPVARPEHSSPGGVAEPALTSAAVLEVDEPCEAFTQYSLLIRRAPKNIVVAALELLSPSNKGVGNRFDAEKHLRKRAALLESGVSVMEVDTLREGHRVLPAGLRRLAEFDRVWWTAFHSGGNRRLRGAGWNEADPIPDVGWQIEPSIQLRVDLSETCRQACEFNDWERLLGPPASEGTGSP